MFIPIHDANRLRFIRIQYVTLGIIAFNVVVFALLASVGYPGSEVMVARLGFTPAYVFDYLPDPAGLGIGIEETTVLTYAFVHADLFHLGGNMLFLWVFGDNIEDAMGHRRFIVFYLLCAVAGALTHGLMLPASAYPLVGASGAVAGIVAAYLILHPRVKIWILAFNRIPVRLPAWIVLSSWIGFQFLMFVLFPEDAISWAAHLGGILAGASLVVLFKRPNQPLLDRTIATPDAVVTD